MDKQIALTYNAMSSVSDLLTDLVRKFHTTTGEYPEFIEVPYPIDLLLEKQLSVWSGSILVDDQAIKVSRSNSLELFQVRMIKNYVDVKTGGTTYKANHIEQKATCLRCGEVVTLTLPYGLQAEQILTLSRQYLCKYCQDDGYGLIVSPIGVTREQKEDAELDYYFASQPKPENGE